MNQTSILTPSINTPLSGNKRSFHFTELSVAIALAVAFCALPASAADADIKTKPKASQSKKSKPKLDRSGSTQMGEASIYAHKFANKKMADGNLMDPEGDNAASKTLPFGTRARVTNLGTGQSTEVTIQDRGPHVRGRIIDLPQAKAEEIGISLEEGVAQVEVAPIEVPQRDGSVKFGDGAISEEN